VRPQDEALWEALRQLRSDIAKENGVPPYVIFHDATLREMCLTRPDSLAAMSRISGIGEQKLNHYGHVFLEEIKQHPLSELLNNGLTDTVNDTLLLLEQGHAVDSIAKQRDLKPSTVYSHLAEGISSGLLDVKDVLDLESAQIDEIILTIESLGDESQSLKAIYQALDENYDYGAIRCVLASLH
jgi:ATP-dependent DNA helicase RecQ